MPTEKPKYAFYADPDVVEILDSWDSGVKSKEINEAIRQYVTGQVTTEKRLLKLEKEVKELKRVRRMIRERQAKIIQNFIASLDLDEPLHVTKGNVERDIKAYGFTPGEAHDFRIFAVTAKIEGKAGVLRDLQEYIPQQDDSQE